MPVGNNNPVVMVACLICMWGGRKGGDTREREDESIRIPTSIITLTVQIQLIEAENEERQMVVTTG